MHGSAYGFVSLAAQVHQKSPVIEFGSRQLGNHPTLRPLFPECEYIGCDVQEGKNVDRLVDIQSIKSHFEAGCAKTVLACNVLEHVLNPIDALNSIHFLLDRNEGIALIAVPFCFPFHHLPDYWRFTPQIFDELWRFNPRLIFFQGKYQAPHTILVLLAHSVDAFDPVRDHLLEHAGRIPGSVENEKLFLWGGQEQYIANTAANRPDEEDEFYKVLFRDW